MAVQATIDNTLGLLFVTTLISSALYGAGMLQGWLYFRKYNKRDHWGIRYLVAFVLLCDSIQVALLCAAIYRYSVSLHDDPTAMLKMEKVVIIELFFGGAVSVAVQSFFCWRIYMLSRNRALTFLLWLVCISNFVILYVYSGITINYANLGELIKQQNLALALNVTSAAADLFITAAMVYYLHISKTGFKRSTDTLNRLIIFTFNNGLPTSFCALADIATCYTLPNTFIYMGFFLIMDRFYTNCLLVALNSRKYIRGGMSKDRAHESISLDSRGLRSSSNRRGLNSNAKKTNDTISIQIHQSTTTDNDGFDKSYP